MKHFFLLLALILLLSGCGDRKTIALLNDVESYIQTDPDSALSTIRTIDTTMLSTRSLRAHYALLHAMALDKCWIDTTDASVVMPAIRYYDRRRSLSSRAKSWYYLGRIQYNGRHYDEAIISFTRAKEYAGHLDDNRFKALIYQAIADTYNSTYLFEEALSYSQEAYRYDLLAKDTFLSNATLYKIARQQNNLNNYQAADSIYRILLQTDKINPQTKPCILADYAFLTARSEKDFDKASDLFEKALSYGKGFESYSHWGSYAYCLYRTGHLEKSEKIFRDMEQAGLKNDYVYLFWKSRIKEKQNDFETAYELLKAAAHEQTESVRKLLEQSTIKAQRDYFSLQNDALQEENRLTKWLNLLLVLFMAVASMVVFSIIHHYREKARRHSRNLMEAVQDLISLRTQKEKTETLLKRMEQNHDAIEIQRTLLKQEFFHLSQDSFRELSDLCNTYFKTADNPSQAEAVCAEVRGYLKKIGIGYNHYPALERRVNEQFDHIMEHFRAEQPNHREQFFQTACYLFAGFKIRTIALLLHLSEQDVYQVRWRLKKEIDSTITPHQKDFQTLLSGHAK